MDTMLWIVRGMLALVFLASAAMKGTWDRDRLVRSGQTGVQGLPLPLIRFIALCELAGALGLVLPAATGVLPGIGRAAAVSLAVLMVLAAVTHTRLREPRNVAVNLVLLALCVFVAVGPA